MCISLLILWRLHHDPPLTVTRSDEDLQLLSCPLQSSPAKPRSKRAKVSGDKEENPSIHSRVASGRYNTLQEFLNDFEKASTAVIEKNKSQAYGEHVDQTPVTGVVNRIAAFKKLLNSLIRQSDAAPSDIKAEPSESDADAPGKSAASDADTGNGGVALTLFGNPSNPKQLFTSLQKPVKVSFPSSQTKEKFVELQTPLREDALPNGITATKISPYDLKSQSKEPKRTFGEVFAPRPTLPQLEPPRKAKSSFKNSSNAWIDPFDAVTNFKAFPGDRTNYSLAALPSGQWLQYGGVTSSPSFWSRRQKQQPLQHSGDGDGGQKHNDDALLLPEDDSSVLQGVYSSFAPSFDSSGAVVQADSKNLVWWSRRGASRLNTLLSLSHNGETEGETTAQPGNIGELDETTLEEMVNNFKEENYANTVAAESKETEESEEAKMANDLDEMLRDISELLETLSSYQRVRNLDLPTANSKGTEPNETSLDFGDPSTPSEAERGIYETLKSSLAAMISNLPPYAVAKLDGDQLAELNISQKVLIENPDYHGTMEKDDFTLQQERAAAMAPASGSVHRTSTPRSAGYNRVYHPGARIQQTQGSFQTPQAYYGGRPSIPGPYAGHPSPYAAPRAPATPSQRANYLPAQPGPQYNQANALSQFQRPSQNGHNPYSAQQGPPSAHASPSPYSPRSAAYNAPYGAGRSASPQKAPYGIPQQRPPDMTPGSTNQQQRYPPQYPQTLPSGSYPPNQAPEQTRRYSNSTAAITYTKRR